MMRRWNMRLWDSGRRRCPKHRIEVEFDDFGWEKLTAEAARQGVTVGDLLTHAAWYFLANTDERRVSYRVFKGLQSRDLSER